MRVALYGGTFDPPHLGHLRVAQAAARLAGLQQLWFVPVAAQPLKPGAPIATYQQRTQMLELMLQDAPEANSAPVLESAPCRFLISPLDQALNGDRPNYTAETIERALTLPELRDAQLYWLIGADSLHDFARWYRAAQLPFLATFLVAARPGFPLDSLERYLPAGLRVLGRQTSPTGNRLNYTLANASGQTANLILLPQIDEPVSATHLRCQLQTGAPASSVVPVAASALAAVTSWLSPSVARYIQQHGLYS